MRRWLRFSDWLTDVALKLVTNFLPPPVFKVGGD